MSAARATIPTLERRRERRAPVRVSMLIRGFDRAGERFEERTSSLNLCLGGAAFATRFALDLGTRVEINISVNPTADEPETEFSTHGRVVHLYPEIIDRKMIVGVEITGPRFHRIFASETAS